MTIGCNIWMICLKLNRFFYGLSRMLYLSEFVWTLRSSVLVVFNNFVLIDATDRSKISSDQKRIFIALSLYPLSFFANTPFKFIQANLKKWDSILSNTVNRFNFIVQNTWKRIFSKIKQILMWEKSKKKKIIRKLQAFLKYKECECIITLSSYNLFVKIIRTICYL